MTRYRRPPTEVEAIFWSGSNEAEAREFCGKTLSTGVDVFQPPILDVGALLWVEKSHAWCGCPPGTWIIAEPDGAAFYPCDAATFETTYEVVE